VKCDRKRSVRRSENNLIEENRVLFRTDIDYDPAWYEDTRPICKYAGDISESSNLDERQVRVPGTQAIHFGINRSYAQPMRVPEKWFFHLQLAVQ
jgi:hypothetical protein